MTDSRLISAMNTRLLQAMVRADTFSRSQRRATNVSSLVLGLAGTVLYATSAHAQISSITSGGADPSKMLVAVCTFILGPFGQTLAVLGIIGIGLAWMFGRVSLGLIAGVIGGIIIMFGSSYLGSTLMGTSGGGTTQ